MNHESDDDLASALQELAADAPARLAGAPRHGDRPCPICGNLMQVESENGVEIDVCPDHGVWLDRDELAAILSDTVRKRARSRGALLKHIRRAKRDGKIAGAMLGWWSLLLPE